MTSQPLFLAASGMITPLGADTAMTSAAVNAGISAYALADFYNRHFQPIKVTEVPPAVFAAQGLDVANWSGTHAARVMAMASLAIQQVIAGEPPEKAIPLVLALPEASSPAVSALGAGLVKHLADTFPGWISTVMSRCVYAGFLLLTRNPALAAVVNGHRILLHPPGMADEPGHLGSDEPYRGDGLDQAFKKALAGATVPPIHSLYSSMNGEHMWAKEYGVAYIRNRHAFADPLSLQHPADCYGDIGRATAPVLIALAAQDLWKTSVARAHQLYSSSDGARRGAIILEKVPA
ncbi:hypothetical protein ACSV5M_00125 [Cellvibrio sp. ARAG 10.3]|uniref:hypothetical protein n=1 Tax=Cellvibrio sp. ARAG 10.3 TaxID=3451358 RepID=UPI003F466F36